MATRGVAPSPRRRIELLKRMSDWEILVPESSGNFFANQVLPGDPHADRAKKGPT